MNEHGLIIGVVAMIILAFSPSVAAEAQGQPEITSQGFVIEDAQSGVLGNFGRLRVRVEAPNRIAELHIKERSYEVDLANTPDVSHLNRFGLQARPRQRKDVTLNFENYINEKLEVEGLYEIFIRVIDKKGNSANSSLRVSVRPEIAKDTQDVDLIQEQQFLLSRAGTGSVSGAERFGIGWINRDDVKVVIRIAKARRGAAKLVKLTTSDYEAVRSKEQLRETINGLPDAEVVELTIANNGAAGEVFAVVNQHRPFILNVNESTTALTAAGTIVTLRGTVKF